MRELNTRNQVFQQTIDQRNAEIEQQAQLQREEREDLRRTIDQRNAEISQRNAEIEHQAQLQREEREDLRRTIEDYRQEIQRQRQQLEPIHRSIRLIRTRTLIERYRARLEAVYGPRGEGESWNTYLNTLRDSGRLGEQDRRLISLAFSGRESLYRNISENIVHLADTTDIAYYISITPEDENRTLLMEMFAVVFGRTTGEDVELLHRDDVDD
jgi:DNA repair exonuclease SbcCD ATPase subunit